MVLFTDLLVSADVTRPGIRMRFKSSTQDFDRNASQPMVRTETSTLGHASGTRTRHLSSWFPSKRAKQEESVNLYSRGCESADLFKFLMSPTAFQITKSSSSNIWRYPDGEKLAS
ncbi:hypothetical protein MKW92_048883 [Papaver armeniacum]|nr:hypothetical protein MKW92_048883 [Papaver armeniacum]